MAIISKNIETEKSEAAEKNRMKIGMVIPLGETDHGKALSYSTIRNRALQAEDIGLDSIWFYDHLIHRFPGHPTVGFWENWTVLSAIAEATNRVEIGTWVLGPFRNPALVAKMADTFEEVSGNRLILGLGAGWHKQEFDAFGVPFENRVSRFEESLQIITSLLRTGYVDFEGKYYYAKNCELKPRGSQAIGPKIMIGAAKPRMMKLAARYADMWNTDWLGTKDVFRSNKEALARACKEEKRKTQLEISGGISIAYPQLGDLPSWLTKPEQALSGSPEEIAAGLKWYEEAGTSHMMCNLYPHTERSYELLGEAVKAFRKA